MALSKLIAQLLIASVLSGCHSDSIENHYVLAEKLWRLKKYNAALSEFERVLQKDPDGPFGERALYQAGMTHLFVKEYREAADKLRQFIQRSKHEQAVWEAEHRLGDIYYQYMADYQQAFAHYSLMLEKGDVDSEVLFRLARSAFFLGRFHDSKHYLFLLQDVPVMKEKALLEKAHVLFVEATRDSQRIEGGGIGFEQVVKAYQMAGSAQDAQIVYDARFGEASSYEALGRLDQAIATLMLLSPDSLVKKRIERIRERMAHKKQRMNGPDHER